MTNFNLSYCILNKNLLIMKKISIFLLATVIINSAIGQTIWDDFDNPENVVYAYHDGIGFDQMFINFRLGE